MYFLIICTKLESTKAILYVRVCTYMQISSHILWSYTNLLRNCMALYLSIHHGNTHRWDSNPRDYLWGSRFLGRLKDWVVYSTIYLRSTWGTIFSFSSRELQCPHAIWAIKMKFFMTMDMSYTISLDLNYGVTLGKGHVYAHNTLYKFLVMPCWHLEY